MKQQNTKLPENVTQLIEKILEKNPMHRSFIQMSLDNITHDELKHLEIYLDFCAQKDLDTHYIAQCYLTIVDDVMREQIHFMSNKEYRHKCFADVADDVYYNKDYMDRYMYGLAITSFFWPNHLGMKRFFNETLPRQKVGKYLEIGPGHGYYIMSAMQNGFFDSFLGIDISEASIQQTQSIVEHFQPDLKDCFQLMQTDFLQADELEAESFDAIVMGEVLEHVEKPEYFLQRIVMLAKPDSYIYITTCINAPAIDHIYLWRTTDDLEKMIVANGLSIKTALRLPYVGKTLEESNSEGLAVNVAYVLTKNL